MQGLAPLHLLELLKLSPATTISWPRWTERAVAPSTCGLGPLDTFLEDFVFGPRYAEIVPDADQEEWFQLLVKLGLAWRAGSER